MRRTNQTATAYQTNAGIPPRADGRGFLPIIADELAEIWFKANASTHLAATYEQCRAEEKNVSKMPPPCRRCTSGRERKSSCDETNIFAGREVRLVVESNRP